MKKNYEIIKKGFKHPIEYNTDKKNLDDALIDDLNLKQLNEMIFSPKTCLERINLESSLSTYTTDVIYLKDTQRLIEKLSFEKDDENENDIDKLSDLWLTNFHDKHFKHSFGFIDYPLFNWLNENEIFLSFLSIYNILCPILTMLLPFVMILIPFFIIQLHGIEITFETYFTLLGQISEGNAMGRLFFNFHSSKMEEKVYLIVSASFYLFSFYQNILYCLKFAKSVIKINDHLCDLKKFFVMQLQQIRNIQQLTENLKSYQIFHNKMVDHSSRVEKLIFLLSDTKPFEYKLDSFKNIGKQLCNFYQLYKTDEYTSTIIFSFGFHGYYQNLRGLKNRITNRQLGRTTFKKNAVLSFKKLYYAGLINDDTIIYNDLNYKSNIVLTGPNASGKTTILKASLINLIYSQQFGFGCFEKCVMKPYHHFHCYLNINDTIGRDSLFQSESKKCQLVINSIIENLSNNHYCVFDELFSGTNPDEAVRCGLAYISYLCKKKTKVDFILTTHYKQMCEQFTSKDIIQLYKMKVDVDADGDFNYLYKLEKGLNCIEGGVEILKQMNFPKEIIEQINS